MNASAKAKDETKCLKLLRDDFNLIMAPVLQGRVFQGTEQESEDIDGVEWKPSVETPLATFLENVIAVIGQCASSPFIV